MATKQLSIDPEKLNRVSELQSQYRDKQEANATSERQIANARQALKVSKEEAVEIKKELDKEMEDLPDELVEFITASVTATTSNGRSGRSRGGTSTKEKLDWAADFLGDETITLTELNAAYRDKGFKGQSSTFREAMEESGRFTIKGEGRGRQVSVKKERKKAGK